MHHIFPPFFYKHTNPIKVTVAPHDHAPLLWSLLTTFLSDKPSVKIVDDSLIMPQGTWYCFAYSLPSLAKWVRSLVQAHPKSPVCLTLDASTTSDFWAKLQGKRPKTNSLKHIQGQIPTTPQGIWDYCHLSLGRYDQRLPFELEQAGLHKRANFYIYCYNEQFYFATTNGRLVSKDCLCVDGYYLFDKMRPIDTPPCDIDFMRDFLFTSDLLVKIGTYTPFDELFDLKSEYSYETLYQKSYPPIPF